MTAELVLLSPLDGWAAPLAEVPDPVFAQAMLGDGVAVDPTGSVLHAPCDGTIISVHAARHAVSLRAEGGVEILMHVGLDTVTLGGEGFEVHVAEGQAVRVGERLISFDLAVLAEHAKSLITPIVVTDAAGRTIATRITGAAVKVGDRLLTLSPPARVAETAPVAGPELTRAIVVPLVHGLHARPAARVAEVAKRFQAEVSLLALNRRANARSPVGIMSLGLRHGDAATLAAAGPDAAAALEALAELIEGGMGEGAPIRPPAPEIALAKRAALAQLKGVMASPGLAVGKAVRLFVEELQVVEAGQGAAHERAALEAALAAVSAKIAREAESGEGQARRAILGAHAAFLDDPELTGQAARLIGEGKSAGFAWRSAIGAYVEALRGLGDRRIAERVDDLLDLERRVLLILAGEEDRGPDLPPGAILLAEELLPSQLMGLDAARLAGICTAKGGPTSHVAILAASMGVPAVVAAGAGVAAINEGTSLILDADAGLLHVAPDAKALEAAQTTLAVRAERRVAARAASREDCRMADGTRIKVYANLGSLVDAEAAEAAGAEGCGLLRTEFLFLERETAPDEDEQTERYGAIAAAMGGRPMIIRLLDVGGDKTASYLPIWPEENPALGVRGVRVLMRRPQVLKTQLRAILRGAPHAKIMIPMVASLSELRAVRAALDEARREMGRVGRTDLGVMIETPAAAATADLLAAEADFLSVGTNDLTQYALAMDRGNPDLAGEIDALHPAVLRMIAQASEGGRKHALWTGVCGGLAGDLAAVPILIGLGVSELSMPSAAIPEAKALIRTLSPEPCADLARRALAQPSAEAVRALSNTFLTGEA
ncbi:PTS galactitol transporter subunit IIC [Phenylobacterium sp. Root77]|uniref:phosphoenolpyruvate--protein phosphotransferase n=1 Tax=unclassified Phenylobacterium TaxID=2640670 RepID=UPI0006FA1F9C|nr:MULTISPECIES: phosphoenolpyruvate--protein phosphotransferase [unclassified Phenylobacterium]KQW66429.1 PTS galactitol transporter subunit IIC [Phenylobacterium sp. Root1277]KQW88935.1 PTS galactitol transporter subunit IIC [Phenylobacterium sp. Root1290]KRC42210.1 PTS galactitol transporter subunit IIC [Phenylobacterium sp. Root77]